MQDAGYKAMSVPISGCDFMFEFGYVKIGGGTAVGHHPGILLKM